MTNSALNTIIQEIDKLTLDEQRLLSNHLNHLTHNQEQSPILRSKLIIIQSHKQEILQLASNYGASNVRMFSLNTKQNEMNFLVDLDKDRNLLDLGGLLIDLRELLGFEVFVFTQEILKDNYREQILQNAMSL